MAAKEFIQDLSEYLFAGNLSDLTLIFDARSWQIHKALACSHSIWFRNGVNSGFQDSESGVYTLEDDPVFADAIDCMVTYFYKADYDVSRYDTPKSLLHAQVAIIADKYCCASLHELARTSLADAIKDVESNDWVAVAALVYDYTIPESPAHKKLRSLVAAAFANRPVVLRATLQLESTAELLRSNADLATDLLLSGPYMSEIAHMKMYIFICGSCRYAHAGSRNCVFLASEQGVPHEKTCPQCGSRDGECTKRHTYKIGLKGTSPCPFCDGRHTVAHEGDPAATEDADELGR